MQRFLLLLPCLAVVTGCSDTRAVDQFADSMINWSKDASARDKQSLGVGTGEITNKQFYRLNYLAPGQSRQAMNSWARQLPAYVSNDSEWYRIPDQPGTCTRLNYSNGTYQGYTIDDCN